MKPIVGVRLILQREAIVGVCLRFIFAHYHRSESLVRYPIINFTDRPYNEYMNMK